MVRKIWSRLRSAGLTRACSSSCARCRSRIRRHRGGAGQGFRYAAQRAERGFCQWIRSCQKSPQTELGLPEVTNSGSGYGGRHRGGCGKRTRRLRILPLQLIRDAKTAAENQVKASNFPSIGQQMINGIISGINAGTSGLESAMADAAAAAYNAAKRKLDIRSPSHLFENMIGLMTMKGWTQGVKRARAGSWDQMKHSVQSAIEAAGGILSFGTQRRLQAVAMLRQGVMMNNLQLATAGAAASGMSVTNVGGASSRTFVQNIYSHDALSPAEMSTEAMAAMERDEWRLP